MLVTGPGAPAAGLRAPDDELVSVDAKISHSRPTPAATITPSSANWRWRGVIRSASCAPKRVTDWRRAAAEGGKGDTITGLRGG